MSEGPRLIGVGGVKPREFALVKSEIKIGSESGNDLVIDEATVARRHAVIWAHGHSVRITDVNSANGTFVNGRRVVGSVILKSGDEIKFGSASYRLAGVDATDGPSGSAIAADPAVAKTAPVVRAVGSHPRPAKARWSAGAKAKAIVAVAIVFAVGFIITDFVTNLSRMETAASSEDVNGSHGIVSSPAGRAAARQRLRRVLAGEEAPPQPMAPATSAAPIGDATSAGTAEATPGWLAALNRYRQTVRLEPVIIDPSLKTGTENHARYLIFNYLPMLKRNENPGAAMHTEDPAKPYYTPAGKAAAVAGDVDFMVGPPGYKPDSPSWAIDPWMSGPFHRMTLLSPWLRRVGYGEYCSEGVCSAVLNVLSGSAQPLRAPPFATPIEFPADGAVTSLRQVVGEWPDPASPCPGFGSPSGLPITLELGMHVDPQLSAYALTLAGTPPTQVEACGYTAATYVNRDPATQARGRSILSTFGAAVVVPRAPLVPGKYTVAITAVGRLYQWSFVVK